MPLAKEGGILFDPVYSGKGLDGMINLIRQGAYQDARNTGFLHAGGSAALFGYPDTFDLHGYS